MNPEKQNSPDLTPLSLWAGVIEQNAKSKRRALGSRTAVFASTASTNDLCWQIAGDLSHARDQHGLLVLADHQTAGRGRRGNQWTAKPGQSILMSVFFHTAKTEYLTLLAGLAVAEGIERALANKIKTTIKWPNDVHIDGKKVSGVLAEGRALGNQLSVVLGIGVNVAQETSDFPHELRPRATSCRLATGIPHDRIQIVEAILDSLHQYTAGNLDGRWLDRWKSRCEMLGRRYLFESAGKRIDAEIVDIDLEHGLIVRDAAGAMHFLHSATTTIIS